MRLIKWLSVLATLLCLFVAYRLLALTKSGEMIWFALDRRAVLIENGKQVDGWLHREWNGRVLIVTRNKGPAGKVSYLVMTGRRSPFVEGCDGWTAIRSPVLPFPTFVSDALPCPGWRMPEHPTLLGKALLTANSVEFMDEEQRMLQARWQ